VGQGGATAPDPPGAREDLSMQEVAKMFTALLIIALFLTFVRRRPPR
jgi:hypothetical protein